MKRIFKIFAIAASCALLLCGCGGRTETKPEKETPTVKSEETDENLQSVKRSRLYFAGEILNVDGECGGYNLQWAFTSAHLAAEGALS